MSRQPVAILVGPTGAGKTGLALALAATIPLDVINADSRQVYADFPLITAQPSQDEQSVCPHKLYGFLSCDAKITAGEFVRLSRLAIEETASQGRLPLLVGGTGLYLRALLEGLAPIPDVPPEVTESLAYDLQEKGLPALRCRLEEVDPEYAAKIHPNDTQRTLRALEVWRATGRSLSWWHGQPTPPSPYTSVKLGVHVSMQDLEPLLARRIELMLEAGALEEARAAYAKCSDPKAPGWSGIGCAELLAHIKGESTLEEAKTLWLRNTRAYAKRQMTWFRKETGLHWVTPDGAGKATALELVAPLV